MEQHIKTEQYLETVCSQIRYKKIHGEIRGELGNHINDQKEAYKARGIDDEAAELKALEQMGDPVAVGTELDRTHRPKPEWSIIALTALLLLAGTFMRFFSFLELGHGQDQFYRQLFFTVTGVCLTALFFYLDFTFIGKYPKAIFLSLAASVILIIAASRPVNGRYIYASCMLLLFPAAFAGIIYTMRNKGYRGILCCGLFFMLPFAISLYTPSVTSFLLIVVTCLLILTLSILKGWFGANKLYYLLLVYIPAAAFTSAALAAGVYEALHRRLALALSPSLDPMGAGYIGNITRQLLSGAKFAGQGALPGSFGGMSASQFLPGINNDFLLLYTIHRFGWLSFIIVAVLLAAFILRAFIVCAKQKSVLAFLVSTAVTMTFALQTLFYFAANLGFQLFAPLSLPLISQSSSYLLINMCLIGILLSVFRTGYFIRDRGAFPVRDPRKNPFLKFENGKLIIDFNIR